MGASPWHADCESGRWALEETGGDALLGEGNGDGGKEDAAGWDANASVLCRHLLAACRAAGDTPRAARVAEEMAQSGLCEPSAISARAIALPDGAPPIVAHAGWPESPREEAAVTKVILHTQKNTRYVPRSSGDDDDDRDGNDDDDARARGAAEEGAGKKRLRLQCAEKKVLAHLLARGGRARLRMELIGGRMCRDCHALFEGISRLLGGRVVVCVDTEFAHYFRGGACSCGGDWWS